VDTKKFGAFIAAVRKEQNMTQLELAGKLQVTDKAVSKWERGLGFPDINTLEPLADALGVSLLELMRSERTANAEVASDDATAALTDAFALVRFQRKAERAAILKITGSIAVLLFMVFLIDGIGWLGFVMAYLPVIFLVAGIVLAGYGLWRRKNRLPCAQTFFIAGIMVLIPVCVAVFFFTAGLLGLGPVPN